MDTETGEVKPAEPFTVRGNALLAIAICAASAKRPELNLVHLRPATDGPRTVIEATDGRILARLHIDDVAPGDLALPIALVKRFKSDDDIEIAAGVLTLRSLAMRCDVLTCAKYPPTDSIIPAATREGSPVLGAGEGPFGKAFAAGGGPKSLAALASIHAMYEAADEDSRKDIRFLWHDMQIETAQAVAVLKARDVVTGSHVALLETVMDAVDTKVK